MSSTATLLLELHLSKWFVYCKITSDQQIFHKIAVLPHQLNVNCQTISTHAFHILKADYYSTYTAGSSVLVYTTYIWYGVPNLKYVTLRSNKLPEILSDIFKNECASLILFSCRLWIKCLTHIPTCQTHKTYCAMLIIMWTMLLLRILIGLIYCEMPRIYGLFN